MLQMIKIPIVSLYYTVYLMFEEWINVGTVWGFVLAIICGIALGKKEKRIYFDSKRIFIIDFIIIYTGVLAWVSQYGGLVDSLYGRVLFFFYFGAISIFLLSASNKKWIELQYFEVNNNLEDNKKFYDKVKKIIEIVLCVSLIPILRISPYVFARADDYNFGHYTHNAWEKTKSATKLFQAVFEMVKEAYLGWQGTYSSIFMMSLHPAVFNEKLYAIVPFFFILIISFSSYFFIKTIVIDLLKVNKTMCGICTVLYIFLMIQMMPVKQSAFFWYNGAIHYIGAHCVLLCMIAFVVRLCMRENSIRNLMGAIVCAIYVAGANHVTSISTLLLVFTIFVLLFIMNAWEKFYRIGIVGGVYLVALAINIMAPGNFNKMEMHGGINIVSAFIQAFIQSIHYIFGEWMHWTIIITFLFCIPIIWKMVSKIDYTFKYPLIFIGYSWCYMASMFFTPLFTLGHVEVGRFQNIMFMQAILWLIFDIGYICGWIQKRYNIAVETQLCKNEKQYFLSCAIISLGMIMLSSVAEPEKYTSLYAAKTLRDPVLYEYAEDYWYNVELLKGNEKEVILKDLSNIPMLLNPTEADVWYSALRLFYNKDKIEFESR